jgi:hypothetical protein
LPVKIGGDWCNLHYIFMDWISGILLVPKMAGTYDNLIPGQSSEQEICDSYFSS